MIFKNQKQMFIHLWKTRAEENGYRSELSGKQLLGRNHPQWHWQFLHVLPKGSYPKYKLNPDNILLARPDEHIDQEEYEIFKAKKDELIQKYYKEYYGKEF